VDLLLARTLIGGEARKFESASVRL
jgi:hypothetical protein